MTKTRTLSTVLNGLGACSDALNWTSSYTSAQKAWDECERGDWMLWLIGKSIKCDPWTDGRKVLLACSLECAETAKKNWKDKRIAPAVKVLRKWIDGKATAEQAKNARNTLGDATAAADAAAYYAAADDAAYDAAAAADYAAAAAYYAAADAAAAAAAAAANFAATAAANSIAITGRIKILKQCAGIVRKYYQQPPKF